MDALRFDRISKRIAGRSLTRRQALAQAGTGIATGALAAAGGSAVTKVQKASAQEATPVASPVVDTAPPVVPMLFVQAFQSGTTEAIGDQPGEFKISFEQGLGQTIYFSDRPERIVGAMPTPVFLEKLGFTADNPLTYDVIVLDNWEKVVGEEFTHCPKEDAPTAFGTAHLLIEGISDCPDARCSA